MLQERWPPWKAGLYNLEMISLHGCNFWMCGLAYDSSNLYSMASIVRQTDKIYKLEVRPISPAFHQWIAK